MFIQRMEAKEKLNALYNTGILVAGNRTTRQETCSCFLIFTINMKGRFLKFTQSTFPCGFTGDSEDEKNLLILSHGITLFRQAFLPEYQICKRRYVFQGRFWDYGVYRNTFSYSSYRQRIAELVDKCQLLGTSPRFSARTRD